MSRAGVDAVDAYLCRFTVRARPVADGSRRRYVLRVPSRIRTAREAVAWTYEITPERYAELDVRQREQAMVSRPPFIPFESMLRSSRVC